MNNCVDFQVAKQQLDEMGPISDDEKVFLFVMLGILTWFAQKLHVGDVAETETVERNLGRNNPRDNRPFGDFKLWNVTTYYNYLEYCRLTWFVSMEIPIRYFGQFWTFHIVRL